MKFLSRSRQTAHPLWQRISKLTHVIGVVFVVIFFAASGAANAQSSECDMLSFSWNGYNGYIEEFDEGGPPDDFGFVVVFVPYGTDVSAVSPTVTLSAGATVYPSSEDPPIDFEGSYESPVIYTVTAEDEITTKDYFVSFSVGLPEAKMLSMSFDGSPATIGPISDGIAFVTMTLPIGTDLTTLAPNYTLSLDATCDIDPLTPQDFTHAVEYTVYSADGYESTTYVVMVTVETPILVDADGTGVLRFTKKPSASSWSTSSVSGTAGDITTEAAMDSAMNGIAASSINSALANYSGAATSTAHWRYDRAKLGTWPTGNKMSLLKSTLKNTTGGTLGGLAVSYELGAINTPAEQINGYRVYWSLTGAAGAWTPVGTHLQTSSGVSTIHFNIEFTSGWANNGDLYIVWADDNGTGTQGVLTVDKVSFTPTPPAANLLSFGLPGNPGNFVNNDITLFVPFGTDVTTLTPTYTKSYGATCNKASGSAQNFSSPVQYTVTSSDSLVSRVYTVSVVVSTSYWTHGPWTNDADSGIDSGSPYTVAVNFGGGAVTVNGVPFQASASSGTNFSVGGNIVTYNNDSNTVTGNSSLLAKDFFYNGTPRTVTLTNLTPGATYETSFFSVGWENSGRVQDFASGTDIYRIDQDAYVNNTGIRIVHYFVATSPTRSFTITPNSGNTLHLYAMANRLAVAADAVFTSTQLVSSANPSIAEEVTFTATVKVDGETEPTATGNYAFRVNNSVVAIVPVSNGIATYTTNALTPGAQTVSASYSGNITFRSSSASLTQVDNTPLILTVNGGTGGGTYLSGTSVTITAAPPTQGKAFGGWVINSGSAIIADAGTASTTLTLTSSNVTITATYGIALLGGVAPLAWYDAAEATSITASAGKVSLWNDLSGNARHISQAVSGNQPSIAASTIAFNGSTNYLMHNAAFVYNAGSVDVYIVGAISTSGDTRVISENRSTSNAPLYCVAQSGSTNGSAMASYIRNDANTVRLSNDKLLSAGSAFDRLTTKLYQWQDTGTTMSGRVNGGSVMSQSYTRSGVMTLDRFTVGAIGPRALNTTSGSGHKNCGINEVIITPNLSDAQRQKIEGYLAHKWDGIRGNTDLVSALPADHPYKVNPPVMNTAPVAIAQSVSVTYGTAKSITLGGIDPDGNTLTYPNAIVSGPSHGMLTGTAPNLTYTPSLGYSGSDSFTFKVNDGEFYSPPATVSITVADGDRYAQWLSLNGYTLTGGSTGDDDGDGLRNFDEFAFGLNPTSGSSANPIVTPLSKTTHAFTYTRYAYSKLAYTVWTSTDLVDWGENPVPVTEVVSEPNAAGVVTVQATLNSPPLDSRKFFLQVKAE